MEFGRSHPYGAPPPPSNTHIPLSSMYGVRRGSPTTTQRPSVHCGLSRDGRGHLQGVLGPVLGREGLEQPCVGLHWQLRCTTATWRPTTNHKQQSMVFRWKQSLYVCENLLTAIPARTKGWLAKVALGLHTVTYCPLRNPDPDTGRQRTLSCERCCQSRHSAGQRGRLRRMQRNTLCKLEHMKYSA